MKLLILSPIDRGAIRTLSRDHDVQTAFTEDPERLKTLVRDREALIFRSGVDVNAELMKCAPHLKLLIRAGSGCDNIDMQYVRQNRLQLHRIPEPGAFAVAELSFTLMLALARNLRQADQLLRQGRWAKHELSGYLLREKVLGIVGAGNIGSRVGQMGAAWDMEVIGCVQHPAPHVSMELRSKGIELTTFDDVLERSDFLCLHVPLTSQTRNLIDRDALARMKPGSYLINLARGGVVDEQALYEALTTPGRLRGAGLDVHEREGDGKISPLAELPSVLLTPHIGASTVDTQRDIGRRILSIVRDFCEAAQAEPVASEAV